MYQSRNAQSRVADFEREMNKLFKGVFAPAHDATGVAVDIGETTEGYRVEVDLPGVAMKDVELSLLDKTLTIKVQPEAPETSSDIRWHRRERRHKVFEESLRFPLEVDAERVEARLNDGVLRIAIPKAAATQPKNIQIKQD